MLVVHLRVVISSDDTPPHTLEQKCGKFGWSLIPVNSIAANSLLLSLSPLPLLYVDRMVSPMASFLPRHHCRTAGVLTIGTLGGVFTPLPSNVLVWFSQAPGGLGVPDALRLIAKSKGTASSIHESQGMIWMRSDYVL